MRALMVGLLVAAMLAAVAPGVKGFYKHVVDDNSAVDVTHVQLNTGRPMPLVGFGSAGLSQTRDAVENALDVGYAMIDTAASLLWYREAEVGEAVRQHLTQHDLPASSVFIITKVAAQDLGTHATRRSVERSLERLGREYIDAVLIHHPFCWPDVCPGGDAEGTWQDTWAELCAWQRKGVIGSLGVSNFDVNLLEQVTQLSHDLQCPPPAIVQNWMDPFHQDTAVRTWCAQRHIVYQAYSSLGSQWYAHANLVNDNPTLKEIAFKHNVSTYQVILRWSLQLGVSVIPRSRKKHHQRENADVWGFTLDDNDMDKISRLDGTVQR